MKINIFTVILTAILFTLVGIYISKSVLSIMPPHIKERFQLIVENNIEKSVSVCDEYMKNYEKTSYEKYEGKVAEPNYDLIPESRLFRTQISDQLKDGPDFAGHYTIAAWGCGTECQGFAIIDVITGSVVYYEPYMKNQVAIGVSANVHSDIIVLNPSKDLKQYGLDLRKKSLAEIINEDFEAHKARVYYKMIDSSGGKKELYSICTENILDGRI